MIIPQFIHNATNSFALWAENVLLTRGQAYTNVTGSLTNYSDSRLPDGYSAWGAPYKQWVYDSSITGANIPSGFYVDGSFFGRNNGVSLDFIEGRILSSGISPTSAVTGSYAVKDFNFYMSNQDEESLIVEVCENQSQQFNTVGTNITTPYLQPYQQKIPAIFINTETQVNNPIAFGGMDKCLIRMNMIVFAHDPYQLDGVLGIFADTSQEAFKEVPFISAPIDQWGDIKGGNYNYKNLVAASGTNTIFIDDARSSKITDSLRRGLKTELYIGMVDFVVGQMRHGGT